MANKGGAKGAKDTKKQQPKKAKDSGQPKLKGKESQEQKTKAKEEEGPRIPAPPARLLIKYRETVRSALAQALGRKNIYSLPKLEKICLNMGVGKATEDSKILEEAIKAMSTIAGQQAVVTKATKSVSNFKVRKGYKVGCRVTLRGAVMWEFLDRLIAIAIPRIRDFRGINSRAFDKAGNYSLGVSEITIFHEIDADKVPYSFGMDVNFVIKNTSGREESLQFLKLIGMPFAE